MPDLHARIKALAEMEGPCPTLIWHKSKEATERASNCPGGCGGIGRIVLFKVLRVECRDECIPIGYSSQVVSRDGVYHLPSCRGWVPESDLEKACWRLAKGLEQDVGVWYWYDNLYKTWRYEDGTKLGCAADSAEEAVISAAEAWAKEAQK